MTMRHRTSKLGGPFGVDPDLLARRNDDVLIDHSSATGAWAILFPGR
jgi:hypothetical protein